MAYIRKINYYETDQMGIVHHSNYIRFMEEARIAYLGEIGLPYDKMEQDGIIIPVLSVYCEYKQPFRFGDKIEIRLKAVHFNGVKFKLEYQMCIHGDETVRTTAYSEHCFLDKNMKPVRMKRDFAEIYQILENCVSDSYH